MKHLFVDADGCIAKFKHKDKVLLEDVYEEGLFLNKEPVNTVINKLKTLEDTTLYILSVSPHSWATHEKELWLSLYCPFISQNNWYFVGKQEDKVSMLEAICLRNMIHKEDCYLLDDTHSILFEAEEKGFNAIHLSSFID